MTYPVDLIIVGGGPAGIEAALAASHKGFRFILVEAGEIGASIRRWGHVRMFSPWEHNTSPLGRKTLAVHGHPVPDLAAVPTGAEYLEHYLHPIAQSPELAPSIRTGTRVIAVGRAGIGKSDLIGDPRRADHPFQVTLARAGSSDPVSVVEAPILIDASGVYDQPSPFTEVAVAQECEASVDHYIPDVASQRGRYAGKHTVIVGGGFSAATALRDLLPIAAEVAGTRISWILRNADRKPLTAVRDDVLPERARLVEEINRIATSADVPGLTILRGTRIRSLVQLPIEGGSTDGSGFELSLAGDHAGTLTADHVLALTGYRPDTALLAECQVHLCYASDGLMKLSAALLGAMGDDSAADCMAVPAAGIETLRSPEPNLFVIGNKSYGRFSHYLLRSGIEQVETVFDALPAPVRTAK